MHLPTKLITVNNYIVKLFYLLSSVWVKLCFSKFHNKLVETVNQKVLIFFKDAQYEIEHWTACVTNDDRFEFCV